MAKLELSADGTELFVTISAPLRAREVEQLIHDLAEARQDMTPPVPQSLAAAAKADSPVLDLGQPPIKFAPKGQMIRLLFCHGGLGWLAMGIDGREREDFLALVGGQLPQSKSPQ